jgi:TP901 family phage tail tape measure protein
MSNVIRSLVVRIGADLTEFEKGLKATQKQLSTFGKTMTNAGSALTKSITVPLAGIALAAGKVGLDFDDAFDKIRVGTGATGDALSGLESDFKTVFASVPNDMDAVATAIADLNTRTGATGPALQEMATQFLNLSRITGVDLPNTIATATRLFGDWSVTAEDTGGTLDYLFKVSQSTGIGVDTLSDKMVQFGAPLRQMGFGFETAAALIGEFEKEGVNTELVLGGLRVALGKMAREGITDTTAGLIEITKRIKEAGTTGEANAIALEAFGARVGPDMAAAIREGRFDLDEFLKSLGESNETINGATAATAGFSENLATMKNKLLTAIEPLGTALLEALNTAMPAIESLIGGIQRMIEWFSNLSPTAQKAIGVFLLIIAAVGPLLMIIGSIATGIAALIPLITLIGAPILAVIAAVAGLTLAFFIFKDEIFSAVTKAKEAVGEALDGIRFFFSELPGKIGTYLTEVFGRIAEWGSQMLTKAQEIGFGFISAIINFFTIFPGKVSEWLTAAVAKISDSAVSFITQAKALGTGILAGIIDLVKTLPGAIWGWLVSDVGKIKESFGSAREAAKGFGKAILDSIIDIVKGLPGKVWDFMSSAIEKVRLGITNIKNKILDFFSGSSGGSVTIKVPAYATGGIVERPTIALVGEAGPEAIVPLDKINKLDTKSESIIDDRPINIVLQVGSTELGRVVIDSINKLSRQEGRLLLNL